MLLPRQFLILRVLKDRGRAMVLVAADQPEEQAVLWSGPPPEQHLPPHPGLAPRQVCAREDGEPGWLELTPAGVLLSALTSPLPPIEAAELFAAIADALAALHGAGLAHGELTADRIHLDRTSRPTLLGAGHGQADDDLDALVELWQVWCPAGPLLVASAAADAAESLRVWLSVTEDATSTLPSLVASALRAQTAEDGSLTLLPGKAVGPVDEIGMDIGPDESPGGLLDPLTWSGITGEPTSEVPLHVEENTGALYEDTRINAPRTGLLSRLLGLSHEQPPPERFHDGTPSQAIRALIDSQTLDPLPVPDGLPARPGSLLPQFAPEWEENTATAIPLSNLPPAESSAPRSVPGVTVEALPAPDTEPERTEVTTSVEVPNPLLIVAVMMAGVAGAAALWLLLRALQVG